MRGPATYGPYGTGLVYICTGIWLHGWGITARKGRRVADARRLAAGTRKLPHLNDSKAAFTRRLGPATARGVVNGYEVLAYPLGKAKGSVHVLFVRGRATVIHRLPPAGAQSAAAGPMPTDFVARPEDTILLLSGDGRWTLVLQSSSPDALAALAATEPSRGERELT